MKPEFTKLFINNQWVDAPSTIEVKSPYDNRLIGNVGFADAPTMKKAIDAAAKAFEIMRKLPVHKVAEGLQKMHDYLEANLEEIALDLSAEAGKPITLARSEVQRSLHTFQEGVEESKRQYGESIPLDRKPWGEGRTGLVEYFPIGIIGSISPFNFPLNLVSHKVVPALASRNVVVLRPARQTPFSAMHVAKAYEASGLPAGGLNVLPSDYAAADLFVDDERVKMISFTGSPKVGWEIKGRAKTKRVTLELGGNAPIIVHSDADLEKAAKAIASGGFTNAGQSCISAQRIYVHQTRYDEFLPLLKSKVEAIGYGNPADEKNSVGPLINTKEADRIMDWIQEALAGGGKLLTGGTREGNVISPTVLTDTNHDMKVNCMEVFGPVITVTPYENFDTVLAEANNSDFGLQAGLFTNNINLIHKAYQEIEAGGLVINDVSTWRIDHMPYGGVKNSGFGREGVKYAMHEMSEMKLLIVAY
ncbi:MAG: aldehyde dehydrogenase family protein [bacterium]